jgi:spore coat protein U-like protein
MKKLLIFVITITFVGIAGVAMATTVTSDFTVNASVVDSCQIQTAASNVDFGTYDPTDSSPDDDGSGSVVFRCSKGTTYNLYISGTRTMTNGTDNLTFELYSNSGRTTVYPSDLAGATPVTASNNSPVTSNYYGRISALQDVSVGSYTQTLTLTVEY